MGRMHGSGTKREELVVVSITVLPSRPTFCFSLTAWALLVWQVLSSQNAASFLQICDKIPLNWKLTATWPFGLLMLLNQQARRDYSSELAEMVILTIKDKIRVATV